MIIRAPAWLVGLIVGLAGYLRGRFDQRSADAAAEKQADEAAEKTVEQSCADAEAVDHDQLQHEEDRWTAP